MKLSGAEIVIKLLEAENVKYIAGIPGGFNLPIYDALSKSNIKHILARHEQGAAFIAQGISRSTNSVGVCFATSGPGVTNLLTGIADAKLDSIPLVAITGQVPLSAIGTDAFQEVDTFGLSLPICKHNYLIRDVHELFTVIPEAFRIAASGRPGPVLIDIPKNIQTEIIDVDSLPDVSSEESKIESIDISDIKNICKLLNNSSKPVIYAGGGIILGNAASQLKEFSEKSNIPVALTLMGLGAVPSDYKLNLGMLGMHGAPYTNYIMNEADLILALGVRFDDRATGNIQSFCPDATIIHVDIDPSEINKLRNSNMELSTSVKYFLEEAMPYVEYVDRNDWIDYIENMKSKYSYQKFNDPLHAVNVIKKVSSIVPKDSIITTDVGQHQMWVAQHYPINKPRTLLTSGGLGTMGFGLPAAIGAALVNPNKTILCFSGDGSILMNIQELATCADYNLNIKLFIFVNERLGLVKQQQELFYNSHFIASSFITNPDFTQIAKGFGIQGYKLDANTNLEEILKTPGPCVITIPVDSNDNVYPMVSPGASNLDMIGINKN
ncbi:biosynthetic-type acetolactate synthase large subunit [Clostridium sp. MSJ-8]|uniref:biosynthetic-type acetolactate synthase large subunit n=1 Tax=Clostridium sp. MSJ-8 TaxID=2841510 RepID=UPI001C0EFBFE|nr:biosynthetic-type acetolactate synthase large subunit [Clostridium sp. MSJ-8]MBU5488961.1 biosynthetic-type acetolactate synthase large subunit [Clostridium sp. MSJ-8]